MAKSNFKKITSIKETEGGNFGSYDEYKGGGTPRGGVWGGKNGRVGWGEREKSGELPAGAHRDEQPRTADGKFTYNSVNGKETKYESRGETVNPLLTDGENGVKIDEAKKQFAAKQGNLWDKYGKTGKWIQKGDKLITKEGRKYTVKIAAHDIWEIARVSFDIKEGAFSYENENFAESKKGRRSKEEKAAIQQAKQNKGETFVTNPDGSHQQKAGIQPDQPLSTGQQFQINPSIISKFRKIQAVRQAAGVAPTQSAFNQNLGNNSASKLIAGKKGQFAVNPSILSNLGNIVNQYTAVPVPMKNAQKQAPRVDMSGLKGLFNKPKK